MRSIQWHHQSHPKRKVAVFPIFWRNGTIEFFSFHICCTGGWALQESINNKKRLLQKSLYPNLILISLKPNCIPLTSARVGMCRRGIHMLFQSSVKYTFEKFSYYKTSTIPIDRRDRETRFGSINLGPVLRNFFDFFSNKGSDASVPHRFWWALNML